MSVLRYPESVNSTDLQIWDNAAFDNGESEDSSAMFKSSWNQVVLSSTESLDSFSSKENQNPLFENNRLAVKSIHQDGEVKSAIKTQSSRLGFVEKKSVLESGNEEEDDNKNTIDLEIEEIEKEIIRLSSRLEALKIQKAEKFVKTVEKKGGRVIPAKFMERKQINNKNGEEKKMVEDVLISMSAKSKVQTRRGLSMGPSEIVGGGGGGTRRGGMSLGPAEILAGSNVKTRQISKQESVITTPIQTIQNRRKSCFWKLQDIQEEKKITKEMRKSSSVSPKSRKQLNPKIQSSRQAATTVASRKTAKKDESIVNSIQPKKLFKDCERSSVSAANKKPLRAGRIVASRYNNQAMNQTSAMRKRSLPDDQEEDESKRCDKKRSLSVGKSRPMQVEIKNSSATKQGLGHGRVKKRWEIPSEIVVAVHRNSPPPTTTISDVPELLLPSIRTTRCLIETPRDSGPAKRVAELVGRKSYFCIDEGLEDEQPYSSSVCQALNFADYDDDDVEELE